MSAGPPKTWPASPAARGGRADAHAFYEKLGYELTGRRYGRSL